MGSFEPRCARRRYAGETPGDGATIPDDGSVGTSPAPGRLVWQKRFAPTRTTIGIETAFEQAWLGGVASDASKNTYVMMSTSGDLTVDGLSLPSTWASKSAVLAKLDPFGSLIWAKRTAPGAAFFQILPDGDVLYAGTHRQDLSFFGNFALGTTQSSVVCTARFDAAGTKKWAWCSVPAEASPCDLRTSGITAFGNSFFLGGHLYSGRCSLPTSPDSAEFIQQLGTRPLAYFARFDLATGKVTAYMTFPIETSAAGPWWSNASPRRLSDGTVHVLVGHEGPVVVGAQTFAEDRPIVARVDPSSVNVTAPHQLTIPQRSPWVLDSDLEGGWFAYGQADAPIDFGGGPVDVSQGPIPYFVRLRADGAHVLTKTWKSRGRLNELDGSMFALPGRFAVSSYATGELFGAPPASPERGIALTMLSTTGDFERVDYFPTGDRYQGVLLPLGAVVPVDAEGEQLMLAGTTSNDVNVFGQVIANPLDDASATNVWLARVKIPRSPSIARVGERFLLPSAARASP